METLLANVSGKVRRVLQNGKEYLVAPLSLIVPGVLNGSKGALYYPSSEIQDNPAKWNGVPLTLYHPFDTMGNPVSASHPGVAERQYIGVVKNASANGKLRADGIFDVARLQKLAPQVLNALERGQPIELSTGLYTQNEPANGVDHKGRHYDYIARRYQADHVAVLPDQQGACSIKDGCGVLVNKEAPTVNPASWVLATPTEIRDRVIAKAFTHNRLEKGAIVQGPKGDLDPTEDRPLDKGKPNYPEKCQHCSSPTGVNPTTGKCVDCGQQNEATMNAEKQGLLARLKGLLGINADAEAPSEIDPTAPARGLGKGNWSLMKRSNHAKAVTESAEASSGAALENPSGHEEALKIHQDAMDAHIAAYQEARQPSSTKGDPDYSTAGYHKNQADYHEAKVRYHGAQALMHKNKIQRGEAVAVNKQKPPPPPDDEDDQDEDGEAENESYGYSGSINCDMGPSKNMMSYNDAGSASADAGQASMSTGHSDAIGHAGDALGHAKGNKPGKAMKSHLNAAKEHEDEALRLRRDGYHDRAHEHDNAAATHRKAAALHAPNVTNTQGDEPMNREAILNRLGQKGCFCQESLTALNQLTDRELVVLNASMGKSPGGDLDFQEGEEQDSEGLDSEDPHSFDGKPKKTKSKQAGGAGTPDEYNENRSMNLNQLPREFQEDIRYAREMKNRERSALLERITANAVNDEGRKALHDVYARLGLGELRQIVAAMPPASDNTFLPNSHAMPMYFGAASPATNVLSSGPREVEDRSPTLNLEEQASQSMLAFLGKKSRSA